MKPGETIHLGDGAYLHFSGHSFDFLTNDHEHPTDRVCVDIADVGNLLNIIRARRRMLRLIIDTLEERPLNKGT